ncbi:MAG: PIN domain-containing protein [Defluviitaleaceae bacterium]|nr:PIN domain-containing protein [Defluviitaleaceae bacterium]
MVLVDTSVLIDYIKDIVNEKTVLLDTILERKVPFGISIYTFQEVLQGAKSEKEFLTLKTYLSTQTLYSLPQNTKTYEEAARMYFDLRRRGITPRSTIDILITLTAVKYNLLLLHNDKDFDMIADKITNLRIADSI